MFEQLTSRLSDAFRKLTGKAKFDEDNLREPLNEVRLALLEADVGIEVVETFTQDVRHRLVGTAIPKPFNPEQFLVKNVSESLAELIGEASPELSLKGAPAVILLAGLQGAGKTTTAAKLAHYLIKRQNKRVLVASVDVYRPAAMAQLVAMVAPFTEYFDGNPNDKPLDIATKAQAHAAAHNYDVLIVDTAGRLHVDMDMMQEVKQLHRALQPTEVLFVVDAMIGQDAVAVAKAFGDALPLTGIILTKMDGDARGGALLSAKHVTGKPVKFIGMGERVDKDTDGLELVHPERMASRILGMGDMLTLIEDIERKVDKKQADTFAKKISQGHTFDFNDLSNQLKQMGQLGGMTSILSKIPGMAQLPANLRDQIDDKPIKQMQVIIGSMTKKERARPNLLLNGRDRGSRKRRIAAGSGTTLQDINRLFKQFEKMQRMMKKFSGKGGMKGMMQQMQKMMGGNLDDFNDLMR